MLSIRRGCGAASRGRQVVKGLLPGLVPGELRRGPEAISSSTSISAVIADFVSTIRQASLLTPRVVIGSRNNSRSEERRVGKEC